MDRSCIYPLLMYMVVSAAFAEDAQQITPTVLVKGPGIEITTTDFEAEMLRIPASDRDEYKTNLDRISKSLTGLYINRSLALQARELGLDRDPLFMRRVQLYEEGQLARLALEHYLDQAELPDFSGRAREVYLTEDDRFLQPETVHARHILISIKERGQDEALGLAEEVRSRALADEDFQELALEYSDDPSVTANQGDLGYFPAARMVEPFATAAFALTAEAAISEPVLTQFGYHIIQFLDRKPPTRVPFDEVKDTLIDEITRQYRDQLRRDKMAEAYNSIEFADYEAIEGVKVDFVAPANPESPKVE